MPIDLGIRGRWEVLETQGCRQLNNYFSMPKHRADTDGTLFCVYFRGHNGAALCFRSLSGVSLPKHHMLGTREDGWGCTHIRDDPQC